MSELRDSAESSKGSAEEKSSPLENGWRGLEDGLVEDKDLATPGRFFEGASSMVDLTSPLVSKDESPTLTLEQNLRKLLQDVEKIRQASQPPPEKSLQPDLPYLNRFLGRAHALYEKQDFKACLDILHEAHKMAPGNPEVLALIERAEQESQLQPADSDLGNRIAQFKAESLKFFEHGRYSECVQRFKLLTELDPENHDLRDYLQISIEEAEKQKRSLSNVTIAAPPENRSKTLSKLPAPDVLVQSELSPNVTVTPPQENRGTTLSKLPAPDVQVQAELSPVPSRAVHQEPDDASESLSPNSSLSSNPVNSLLKAKSELPSESLPEKIRNDVTRKSLEGSPRDLSSEWTAVDQERELGKMTGTSESGLKPETKNLRFVYLLGAGLLFGLILGAWLVLGPPRQMKSTEVQPQSNSNLAVPADRLRPPIDLSKSAEGDEHAQAEKAFKQGRFMEANRLCDSILQAEPKNSFALNLKQQIHERLRDLGNREMASSNWGKAIALWIDVLKINPNDREAAQQLNTAKTNLKKQSQMDLANKQAQEKKIQDLQQQITIALSAGRYLPPNPGNAIELIQKLDVISPDSSFSKEKLDQILHNLVAQANRSLQARDYASASTLVKQMQNYFPETPELKTLVESLKAEESRLIESRNSWMQKAEAAMSAGHYVTPATDNVIAYCNLLLASQPQAPKALELKKDSLMKAVSQAKALAQDGKYDDAKLVYSALLYLSQNENGVPLSSQDLKREIDRLTFNAYAVIHDHTIGSCTGRLRFNGYQIAYIPSTDSNDGFALKLSEIVQVETGDKLKIQFKGKTYRFQANASKNVPENRARIGEIEQRLTSLKTSSQQPLH